MCSWYHLLLASMLVVVVPLVILLPMLPSASAFVPIPSSPCGRNSRKTVFYSSPLPEERAGQQEKQQHGTITNQNIVVAPAVDDSRIMSLTLMKPLGIMLEEVGGGGGDSGGDSGGGVIIAQVDTTPTTSGSAAPYVNQIQGARLSKIQNINVMDMSFDTIMDLIRQIPIEQSILIELILPSSISTSSTAAVIDSSSPYDYPIGTTVTIQVMDPSNPNNKDPMFIITTAKVGDNLRQTLLNNNVPVYQGLKQTLGNCGGAGQCTFCAMDVMDSQGWVERSDYENKKLNKFPNARLACLNPIQGPATIRKTQR